MLTPLIQSRITHMVFDFRVNNLPPIFKVFRSSSFASLLTAINFRVFTSAVNREIEGIASMTEGISKSSWPEMKALYSFPAFAIIWPFWGPFSRPCRRWWLSGQWLFILGTSAIGKEFTAQFQWRRISSDDKKKQARVQQNTQKKQYVDKK